LVEKKGSHYGPILKLYTFSVHCMWYVLSSNNLPSKTKGILLRSLKTSFHGSLTILQSVVNKAERLQVTNLIQG